MNDPRSCDVVGIGFGPSNLGLAVALDEHNRGGGRLAGVFFERQEEFTWHRDMLIEGATVQVSFLKDLVTLRRPTSEYSFLAYLHAKERLIDFVNHKNLFPSRIEFNDYLRWVAGHFAHLVDYSCTVVGVRPVRRGGRVEAMDVTVRRGGPQGRLEVRRARNIVLGTGLRPALPPGTPVSARVWHSDELLTRIARLQGPPPRRIVVVGAGQSAAEVVEYAHRTFTDAEVCAVFARYGYSPADDSPFANRVFDPEAVDLHYAAGEDVRRMMSDYHRNTNYSVVDTDLIDELYRRFYQEKVSGRRRLRILNLSRVVEVLDTGDGVRVVVESLPSAEPDVLDADLVVLATGYRESDVFGLLGEMGEHCLRDQRGRPRVTRDYRVETADDVECGIYLQGPTEHTHGISSGLLSNIAVRSGEILHSIAVRSGQSPRPAPAGRNGSAAQARTAALAAAGPWEPGEEA
ncbi:L-lysine 6-monooxygenase [Nonomuraea sp. WAC 01424]|uniref:lysine N(6)-hydroxylase/L-ornithine N(5)-oxygenase family protein n=1 Tax=Nonomuraea sp. WAC 01424 TaxID=2203200 RepID=UPI000F792456|nr:lysine N(6)-hydroxylase/L-ornithine N(5)-oxygenase family protein [Nonomuraea sp. WAC 01424]RSN11506.1 L-lysine 6-monooxygenase [Nonomuraea sp. WAC 01424]